MIVTYRPLENWFEEKTPASKRRSRWTFKVPWSQTLTLLDRELRYLRAKNIVLQADFREEDLRLDGLPRANARQPQFPGVKIAFDSIHGPLTYATDVCEFWQHNVRSIALGMEALRAVDRYGISGSAQQYTGYLAIEARSMGAPKPPRFATPDAAVAFLRSEEVAGIAGAEGLSLRTLWHHLVKVHHPDTAGESPLWGEILEAKKVVEKAGLL